MIHLTRERGACIPATFHGQGRIDCGVELLKMAKTGTFKFQPSRWKTAKEQLKKEANEKCAYCEGPTALVAHGDVEHFRPKSIYWWLAYCYENYLYSCQICNQSYKSDHFPVRGSRARAPRIPVNTSRWAAAATRMTPDPLHDAAGYPLAKHLQRLIGEQALLPDPYSEFPEELFAWEADETLKEVAITARKAKHKPRLKAVEEFYGLNREELRRWRWRTYEELKTFVDVYQSGKADDLKAQLARMIKKMTGPDAAFAGMARYFARDVWGISFV